MLASHRLVFAISVVFADLLLPKANTWLRPSCTRVLDSLGFASFRLTPGRRHLPCFSRIFSVLIRLSGGRASRLPGTVSFLRLACLYFFSCFGSAS